VQHGNKSAGACRARGKKSRNIQQELRGTVGVRSSHLFAQRRVQNAYSCRLGGAILEENHEAHASGPHVMLLGPQTYGSSNANCQHSSSGLSYTRATTTSMGGSTGSASEVPRSPRYHRRGLFNANASGDREGYSPSNANHMKMIDEQFQACVAAMKGTVVSPRTPSWIDAQTGKGARLDHLVGLGVEFTCTSGSSLGGIAISGPRPGVFLSQNWNAEIEG